MITQSHLDTSILNSELKPLDGNFELPSLEEIGQGILYAGSQIVEWISYGASALVDIIQNIWLSALPFLAMVSPMTPLGQSLILGAISITLIVAALNSESCTKYILAVASLACALFSGGALASAIRAFDVPEAPVV